MALFKKYKGLFLTIFFSSFFIVAIAYFNFKRMGFSFGLEHLIPPAFVGSLLGILIYLIHQKNKNTILLQKDKELDSITNSVLDTIFMLSKTGKVLYTNKASEQIFGFSIDEIIGNNFTKYVPTSEIPRYLLQLKDVFKAKEIRHFETYIKNKDGSLIPVEVNGKLIKRDGQYVALGSIRDTSSRQKLESEKNRLFQLVNQSSGSIVITNLEGDIEFVNSAFCTLTGYSEEDVIGENPSILKSEVHSKDFFKELWDTISSGSTWRGEICNKKKDGTLYWELATIFSLKDDTGNIINYAAIKENVTAQKLAMQELETTTKDLQIAQKMAKIGSFYNNLETGDVSWSEGLYSIMEMESGVDDAIPCRRIRNHVLDDYLHIFDNTREKLSLEKQVVLCEFEIRTAKGNVKYFHEYLNGKFDEQGKLLETFGTVQDFTQIKKTEKALQIAKEEAESSNKAKSLFLANMSHELRTPLNSILGFGQLLEMQTAGPLNKKQEEYVNYIQVNSDHLLELINDILDLAKVESGKFELEKRYFSLSRFLKRIPDLVKSLLKEKNIELQSHIPEDSIQFLGDETRIKQILLNLLSNAAKFTPQGGNISISTKMENDYYHVIIEDDGIGIPKDDLEKIFLPFEQSKKKEDGNFQGTGLGLAISRQLVQMHGGILSVESTYGKGSIFTMSLPLEMASVKKSESSSSVNALINNPLNEKELQCTLLVVDDNEFNRDLIENILEECNCKFYSCENAEDALLLMKEKSSKIDVVLMDINLPGMNGVDCMKEIKKNYDKPIIAFTANSMKGDEEKYLNQGFDSYISKPINISLFTEKIKKIIS